MNRADEILILIADRESKPGDIFVPSAAPMLSRTLGKTLLLNGGGDTAALRGLVNRGYIARPEGTFVHPDAVALTEKGRAQVNTLKKVWFPASTATEPQAGDYDVRCPACAYRQRVTGDATHPDCECCEGAGFCASRRSTEWQIHQWSNPAPGTFKPKEAVSSAVQSPGS